MLQQLVEFMDLIENTHYSVHLSILSGNTIGKHLRHIIEFYQHLFHSYVSDQVIVNYDARRRDHQTEIDKDYAKNQIEKLIESLEKTTSNKEMLLSFSLNERGDVQHISTTFYRELAYNLEHTIHHLAIIKMAVMNHFPDIQLDKDFGVAYSTVQYQNMQQQ
ncbi:MAG: DinB family protein [Thermoflexibacter sp.]|nr:DinB family protein [Thermoflexibacter sp.]